MTKILIRRDAIEKLVARFKASFLDHAAILTDRDHAMIRWFEEILSDEITPVDRVLREVGKLKTGWARPLSQIEMHELNGSLEALAEFTDAEWLSVAAWLSYKPKSWEKIYQVQNRQSFLRAPIDTLTAAETWRDANKSSTPRKNPVSESVGETMTREEALAILRGED